MFDGFDPAVVEAVRERKDAAWAAIETLPKISVHLDNPARGRGRSAQDGPTGETGWAADCGDGTAYVLNSSYQGLAVVLDHVKLVPGPPCCSRDAIGQLLSAVYPSLVVVRYKAAEPGALSAVFRAISEAAAARHCSLAGWVGGIAGLALWPEDEEDVERLAQEIVDAASVALTALDIEHHITIGEAT